MREVVAHADDSLDVILRELVDFQLLEQRPDRILPLLVQGVVELGGRTRPMGHVAADVGVFSVRERAIPMPAFLDHLLDCRFELLERACCCRLDSLSCRLDFKRRADILQLLWADAVYVPR